MAASVRHTACRPRRHGCWFSAPAVWCRLRDKIDHIMQSDRAMSLVVAIETALEDKRYEVRPPSMDVPSC